MTNLYPGLARGEIGPRDSNTVVNIIANETNMEMGGCAKLATPPSTELLPRADKVDSAGEDSYGIITAGDNDGIYGTGGASPADNTTKASLLIGDAITVCTQGRCLARISENVVLGDELGADATGDLQKADAASDMVVCIALQAGSAGDIIAVDVQREGQF